MKTHQTTRRAVLAGTAAVAGAAMLPASAVAETLAPAFEVDRAGFINRLHQWAMFQPEVSARINRLIANAEHVLSTSEGTGEFLEAVAVCREKLGSAPSLDYLVCGPEIGANGDRFRMFPLDEEELELRSLPPEEERETSGLRILAAYEAADPRARPAIRMALPFIAEGDYGPAREWLEWGYRESGRVIAQI